ADAGDAREALGEAAGIGMVVDEPGDVLVERMEAARGRDAGLAHGAAESLLEAPGAGDVRLAAGEDRADRRAQALGEVQPDRIDERPPAGSLDPGGLHRVHQS